MGAVLNMRPDLFGAVLAAVPFVDMLNTMLDASLPLTVIEYDEWGNPNDPKYYRYIKSYALRERRPASRIRRCSSPPASTTRGSATGSRPNGSPSLREPKTDDNELLLKTEMGSGHFGASGRYNMLQGDRLRIRLPPHPPRRRSGSTEENIVGAKALRPRE